jgi:hypothetical protein
VGSGNPSINPNTIASAISPARMWGHRTRSE